MELTRRHVIAAGAGALLARPAWAQFPAHLDHDIRATLAQAGIPGAAVGYAREGRVRFVRGYGYADLATRRPVTPDTVFAIASITKTITAAAILRLAGQGRLTLDDPVAAHLDFPVVNPHHPDAAITLRHLLTHTSGISDEKYYAVDFRHRGGDTPLALRDMLVGYLVPGGTYYDANGCYAAAAPGEAWDYSNVGFALLGYVAGRVGGFDARMAIRQFLMAPLGLRHSYWTLGEVPPALAATPYEDGKPVATMGFPDWSAGMLQSSVADFTRYIAACANDGAAEGAAEGVRVLPAGTMGQMLTRQPAPNLPTWLSGQGLGWMLGPLDGTDRWEHWGGAEGIFTVAYLDPEHRQGVTILTNATATDTAKAAVKKVAARLLRQGPDL
ncbi:beta-lactamase [Nitrospirillum viridazoti Y2]|uniref:CubicO group peptidase (Beta-lactamase class C family) n=1 Tax=Nitrospirillum amazonense TaxID=28077 RepID=A0A560IX79_9PROT|nr:serine hydrolase domain-containing protein [Nitrospirillum amazonense]EGY01043.1 beta-lactamase [Nitrospirillum amazonense Y2]TWB63516.1 CubicO group peptidase (beta-lactamase class C family) [Nitrospirillum amazonense]